MSGSDNSATKTEVHKGMKGVFMESETDSKIGMSFTL